MNNQIKLQFNLEKSLQAVLYIANRLQRKDFHKIFKILYFSDRDHLSDYGRSITGDSYAAMTDGPVPTNIYDIFKSIRGDGFFANRADEFKKYFDVVNWNFILPIQKENLDFLSETDVEKLDNSLSLYGDLSWDEIREKSHDYAWRNTVKDQLISIDNLLLEKGEGEEFIAFVNEMNLVL